MTIWYFSENVLKKAQLPQALRRRARDRNLRRGSPDEAFPVVVACASELLGDRWEIPAEAIGPSTHYLIVADVPEAASLRVVSRLQLHKPELRLHLSRDIGVVQRLIVAQLREHPFEGIVDAYVLLDNIVLVLGDLSVREFPLRKIPVLCDLGYDGRCSFEIDEDGSFLFWPEANLFLGASQFLQAADPSYLADIEIQRLVGSMSVGEFLASSRERLHLRQGDIPGLSERQVRRIEQGVSRLTIGSAEKLAAAFQVSLRELLDSVSRAAAERVASIEPGSQGDVEATRQRRVAR